MNPRTRDIFNRRLWLLLTLPMFVAPIQASEICRVRAMPCPESIYSPVLNKARYAQECYRITIRQAASAAAAPDTLSALAEGGMFELRLNNLGWPDKRAVCPTIVARMPWSDPDEQPEAVARKADLHASLARKITADGACPAQEGGQVDLPVMITRDSLLHSSVNVGTERAAVDSCVVFFQADGETGRYLGPADLNADNGDALKQCPTAEQR